MSTSTFIFARGQDNQIWYAYRDQLFHARRADAYHGWWQLPPPPYGYFTSDPAVTTYASGDLLMVCAAWSFTSRYACSKQTWGNGGSRVWSSWESVPGNPLGSWHPALTRTSNTVYFLNNDLYGYESMSTSPFDGGAWSGPAVVHWGGFVSGPALAGSTPAGSNDVIVVARSWDSSFLYKTGSSWRGWVADFVTVRYTDF